jgi:hypothetical protein
VNVFVLNDSQYYTLAFILTVGGWEICSWMINILAWSLGRSAAGRKNSAPDSDGGAA